MGLTIAIGADHAAWEAKTEVVAELRELGHQVDDLGTFSGESVHYPRFAHRVADRVAQGDAERGILLCGTGIGMSITANRTPGVRAAVVFDEFTARMAREHNDANVLCIGARVLAVDKMHRLIEIFLDTPFGEGRHTTRVRMYDHPLE